MATRKTTQRRRTTRGKKNNKKNPLVQNLSFLGCIVLGILGIFKLGILGIFIADIFRFFFGNIYLVTLIPTTLYLGYYFITRKLPKIAAHFWVGALMAFIAVEIISSLLFFEYTLKSNDGYVSEVVRLIGQDFTNQSANTPVGGGIIGAALYYLLVTLMSSIGTWIVTVILLFSGIAIFFRIPAREIVQQGVEKAQQGVSTIQEKRSSSEKTTRQSFFKRDRHKKDITDYGDDPLGVGTDQPIDNTKTIETHQILKDSTVQENFNEPEIKWNGPVEQKPLQKSPEKNVENTSPAKEVATQLSGEENPDYQLPTSDLLTQLPPTDQTKEFKGLTDKSRLVHDTLQSFGVEAEVTSVSLGPTVTQYELKPGQGVKVNRIANLADDLALALAAKSIRIEAPIPGKPYVGIEVPNDTQATVGFRDMIENAQFDDNPLNVPLGRDVTGNIIMADLSAMPHLLIAGSTGSGKSVGLNGIIVSILLRAKPNEVKLMMVDPKVVELSIYNGIPHLLTPVVSEPRKAAKSLQKVVDEMENRYKLLAQFGKRNIGEYNAAVEKQNKEAKDTDQSIMQPMPYIVAIVDEFADLMSTVGNEIEVSIARLGAKARAAGIHMILATQRPDVKVINGTIKSNIPGRIAFRTASGIDSRTILDSNGAEKLLGKGDMIFAPPGKPTQRVQGAFISNMDVTNIVEFVKSEQAAQYSDAMTVTDEEIAQDNSESTDGNSDDELFQEALQFVIEQQKASTSLLQRRFRIGYNRAARLIDDLEAGGYIGPADGSRPRHVNISDGSSGIEH